MKARSSCARASRARLQRCRGVAGMHQPMMVAVQIAVVDEVVFLDRQTRIAPLEIARAIADDALAQREILGAGRRTDRIGLHEAQLPDGARERGRLEQRAGDGVAAQLLEGRRHAVDGV